MSKKLTIASLLTMAGLVGALGFAGVSYASEDGHGRIWDILTDEQKAQVEEMRAEGQANRGAQQVEMEQIFADLDYAAWKEAIESKPQITDYINEDNFDRFVEIYELKQAGDDEAAEVIREELGIPEEVKLGMRLGSMDGHGHGREKMTQ